jgi:hypothetical protein
MLLLNATMAVSVGRESLSISELGAVHHDVAFDVAPHPKTR